MQEGEEEKGGEGGGGSGRPQGERAEKRGRKLIVDALQLLKLPAERVAEFSNAAQNKARIVERKYGFASVVEWVTNHITQSAQTAGSHGASGESGLSSRVAACCGQRSDAQTSSLRHMQQELHEVGAKRKRRLDTCEGHSSGSRVGRARKDKV